MDHKQDRYFEKCLYFSTNSLTRSLLSIANEAFSDIEITPTQGFTLLCIGELDIHTPSEIAEELNMKASTITRFLDKLEKLKFIKRETIGRHVIVNLTNLGEEKIKETKICWGNIHTQIAKVLTDAEAENLISNINNINHLFINANHKGEEHKNEGD